MIMYLIEFVAFIVAIGILVTVHESGHFFAARALGFDVLKFSIGFGRPIWRHKSKRGVEYVIGLLPLGGYVKLLDEREGKVPAKRKARSFQGRPIWARILVFLAGPLANFALAFVLIAWVLLLGVPGLKPLVSEVRPQSVSAQAGLTSGDRLVAIDGLNVQTQEDAVMALLDRTIGDRPISLTVDRAGQPVALTVALSAAERVAATEPGALFNVLGFEFRGFDIEPVIGSVLPDSAAARAGILVKDRIIAVDGHEVKDFRDIRPWVENRPGALIPVRLERAGVVREIQVAVGAERDAHQMGQPLVGRLGVAPQGPAHYPPGLEVVKRFELGGALSESAAQIESKSLLTLKFFYKMLVGQVSAKNVSGPIGIASLAGASALGGLGPYLDFLALISLSLGILNLMPLPILDGGQIVIQLVEWAKGSPLSDRANLWIQHMGLLLLAIIMSLAFYNDIAQRLS